MYEESIQAIADEVVVSAERYVHVESFILCWDSITHALFDALVAPSARGVKVRVLFDHLSSLKIPGYKES